MEGYNNQGENSSKFVQQLLPPEPHHSDSETNPHANSSGGGGGPSPNRRPRGRPPGSKNKPRAPVLDTRESPNALKLHVLEVSGGVDIMESLNNYARRRGGRGVCVITGKGRVLNVIIRQPTSSSGRVFTLQGAFEILSVTRTVLPPPAPPGAGGLSIFLSGGQARVLGGNVVGPLIAIGIVVLMVASFANAVFERLPLEVHEEADQENAGNGANQMQQVQPVTSQTSTVTGSVGVGLPLFNAGPASYLFSGDLFGWGGSNAAAPRPPF